jgi:hypothetical protein
MYQMSHLESLPMMVFLPKKKEDFLNDFPEGEERDRVTKWLRNAHTITVVDGEEAVNHAIRQCATHMLVKEKDKWTYVDANPPQDASTSNS